jgi:hypothetical protein
VTFVDSDCRAARDLANAVESGHSCLDPTRASCSDMSQKKQTAVSRSSTEAEVAAADMVLQGKTLTY